MKTIRKIKIILNNLISDLPAEARGMLPMAGLILFTVLLIIIIVIAQAGSGKEETGEADQSLAAVEVSETLPALSATEEAVDEDAALAVAAEDAGPDYGALEKDGNPELLSVMKQYLSARARADVDAIDELYANEETAEEKEESRQVLEFNARYISSFDNITTYEMEGPTEGTWLVYTTTDINFYSATAKAPTIMWCYIELTDDGEYRMLDSRHLSDEMQAYAEEENHSPEVRALAADVNGRLKEALESDPALEEVYGILRTGSPIWENTSEAETEVAVIETEREEEEEPAREREPETEAQTEPAEEETPEEVTEAAGETIAPLNLDESEGGASEGPATDVEQGPGTGAELHPIEAAEASENAGPAGE